MTRLSVSLVSVYRLIVGIIKSLNLIQPNGHSPTLTLLNTILRGTAVET